MYNETWFTIEGTQYVYKPYVKDKTMISYYSQIKNRLHQFKQTVEANLEHIQNNPNTEWVIVDCGSQDGLYEYMRNFVGISGLHYYRTLNYKTYSIPIAKNFAARLSSGKYLFNLDIDNYIGNATAQISNLGFNTGVFCDIFKKGVYGRIGCSKTTFNKVGGYDESFLPAGKHDIDLIMRCNLVNYRFKHIPCVISPILNSKTDTVINTGSTLDWETMNTLNGQKMARNLQNNIYRPNKNFTSCIFEYNFITQIKLSEEML